jgi:hypothetical protein
MCKWISRPKPSQHSSTASARPQDELLYMNLGKTYVTLGNRAKVREVMLRLLEQKPASAAAANALGELEIRELEIR